MKTHAARLSGVTSLPSVALICLVLVFAAAPASALMTDTNLFAALDLNYPGLEVVRSNVTQGNYTAARANFSSYLRTRTNVTWFFDPHVVTNTVSYNQTSADQTTNGYVVSIGIPYTFPNGVIDWYYNVTKDANYNYADNNEWQWQLNRMSFWPNLGATWWGTGNDIYTKFWVGQLRSWLTNCPVPTSVKNGAGSTWRTIESGIRMSGAWPNTYHRFLHAPSFSDQDICDYLKSCIEHSRYLSNYYTSGNWLTMEMSGLYTVGALYPEVKDAAAWRDLAGLKLYMEQTNQFYPDGVQKELSPGYHGVALGNILTIYNVAALEGLVDELPANYTTGLENGYDHYLRMMAPDRTMPQFNDSVGAANAQSSLNTAASLFTNRLDFLWVASNGASGVPPSFTSYNYPWAGYNVMRSGWSRTDNYLCFDNGPLGAAHIHQDKLNIVVWPYGRRLLYDSGGGQYETSIWRSYGLSAYSHNTVIVDGQNQAGGDGSSSYTDADYVSQSPVNSRWETDAGRDFAAGIYNRGYGSYTTRPATHTRRILFVKPDLFLVADTLAPTDTASHSYDARWHLLTTNTTVSAGTKAVTTADAGVPNLAVVPCLTAGLTVDNVVARSNGNYALLLGWNITGSGPSPATTATHVRSGTGTNQFLTLLLPLPTGSVNPVTNVVSTGATSARLELSDGRRLHVHADPNPVRGLRLTEVLADGTTNRIAGGGYTPPVISVIPDQSTAPNTPVGPLAFTVGAPSLSPTNLVVIPKSLDTRIVPDAGIVLGGSASNRTVTIYPAPGRAGSAGIRLTVIDTNGATAATEFVVNVVAPEPATWFWDTSASAGLQPGSGTWSDAVALWSATNTGSSPLLTWPTLGNDAVFAGASGAYVVTVSNTQNVNGITLSNGTFTVTGGRLNHFAGPMKVTAQSTVTINSPITADTDLVKNGTGQLTLGGAVQLTGNTWVQLGTLRLGSPQLLPPDAGLQLGESSNAGTLDLSTASQEFAGLGVLSTNSTTTNNITVGIGQTLSVGGEIIVGIDNGTNNATRLRISGGGSLLVTNAARNVTVGVSVETANAHGNTASVDLSRLGSATLGTFASPIGELRVGYGKGSGSTSHLLTLSDTNNVIVGDTVHIGNSTGYNGSSGTLLLGTGTNFIAADTLNIGLAKVAGTVKFASQSAGSPGTVTIRGRTGTSTAIWLGYKNGTGTAANPNSTLDLRGHASSVTASSLNIAIENGSSSGGETAALYFDTGTFSVTNVTIASKSGTSTGPVTGSLNIGGGVFTIQPGGRFTLASQTTASTASGTLNLTGGILNCYTDISDGGGTNTTTLTINGGTLNLFGRSIGSATNINILNFQSGTVQNVGQINNGATPLIKTTAGTLVLSNANTYTGGTILNAGTLVLGGSLNSSLLATNGVLTGSGTILGNLTVSGAATLRVRLNGTTAIATHDQISLVSGGNTITLGGSLDIVAADGLPSFATFTILKQPGGSPVIDTFNGLPENSVFQRGGYVWRINYQGGDGNDVVLTLLDSISHLQTVNLISTGAVWKYSDLTTDLGTLWRSNGFSDATWPAGPSKLGFGITNGSAPATLLSSNRQTTTYFRRSFVVHEPALVQSLSARLLRDDGAVVYLNGTEIWRDNLPVGSITNQTPASAGVTGVNETNWFTKPLATSLLVSGTNLLAAEIHQGPTHEDLSFDFELSATAAPAFQPELNATAGAGTLLFSWPAAAGFFLLSESVTLTPPVPWSATTNQPLYSNGWWFVPIPLSTSGNRFFRLTQ